MIDKLNKLNFNLIKLEELDRNKFSSKDFKLVNKKLNDIIEEIMSLINIDLKNNLNNVDKVLLENILIKIEKIETKILPKANILNSFSKSII